MKQNQSALQGELFPEMTDTLQKAQTSAPAKKKTRLAELQEQNKQLQAAQQEQQQQIAQLQKENAALKRKAEAFDELIASRSLFTTGVIAKNFGHTAIWLNKYLHDKKVQYNRGDVWMLYAPYDQCGYTRVCWYNYSEDSNGHPLTRPHTYWTSKGLLFIRDLLKDDGLLPEW